MSGQKGFPVSLVSAVALGLREDAACSVRCDQRAPQLAGLAVRLGLFGRSMPMEVNAPVFRTHEAVVPTARACQFPTGDLDQTGAALLARGVTLGGAS